MRVCLGQLKLRNILVPLINIHFVAVTNPTTEFWQHPQFSTLLTHPSHNVSHCILRHNRSCIPPHWKLGSRTRHFYKDFLCKASANHIEKTAPLWLVRQFLNWIFIVISLAKTLSASTAAWLNAFNFDSSHYRSPSIFFAVWDKYNWLVYVLKKCKLYSKTCDYKLIQILNRSMSHRIMDYYKENIVYLYLYEFVFVCFWLHSVMVLSKEYQFIFFWFYLKLNYAFG